MDKCWFVLRQTHYPAPEYVHTSMAYGAAEGPILLGHLIPSPKAIDQVINSGGITPFPRDMRIWATAAADFRLSRSTGREVEISTAAGIPIPAAAGVTVNADAGVLFRRIMGDGWAIDRLDRQIVQPTLPYLEQCRRSAQVAAWVDKHKTLGAWKMYMVTGLIVVRGARSQRMDASEGEVSLGGGADLIGMASAGAKVKPLARDEVETSARHITDFVWAVRLTEVSKRLVSSDLSQKVVTKGTVFAPGPAEVDLLAALREEGLDGQDMNPIEVFSDGNQQVFLTMEN